MIDTIFEENPTIQALFNSIQVGISIVTDISCNQIIHNPLAAAFFNTHPWDKFVYYTDEEIPFQVYQGNKKLSLEELPLQRAAWYGEVTDNEEYVFMFDSGIKKVALLNANPIFDKSGKIIGAIATFHDITEQRKIATEHNHFFEHSLDAFLILDFNRNVLKTNRLLRNLVGKTALKEVSGKVFFERIHPEDREETRRILGQLENEEEVTAFVNRIRNNNGEYAIFSWNCYSSRHEKHIYAVGRDITEIRKKNQQLIESAQEKNEILESISDAFFSLDAEGRFVYINREADRLFDYPRKNLGISTQELIGQSFFETFPRYRENGIYDIFIQVKTTKVPIHFEARMAYTPLDIEVNVYPFKDGVSVYFRDISERKKTEKEMARFGELKLAGEIAASIGHEIRNPMTTVRGYLQLLGNQEQLKGLYKEQFDLMIEELDRANSIITEFLSLSSMKVTTYERKNLNAIINKIKPMVQADAIGQEKSIVFNLEEIPDLKLDENAIRQILFNLIRNGLESMSPQGVLTIETRREDQGVELTIKDQGSGIPPSVLENIGKPFQSTKTNGTGLGLAITYKILYEHNATIHFDTSSKGTSVIVRFKYSA